MFCSVENVGVKSDPLGKNHPRCVRNNFHGGCLTVRACLPPRAHMFQIHKNPEHSNVSLVLVVCSILASTGPILSWLMFAQCRSFLIYSKHIHYFKSLTPPCMLLVHAGHGVSRRVATSGAVCGRRRPPTTHTGVTLAEYTAYCARLPRALAISYPTLHAT